MLVRHSDLIRVLAVLLQLSDFRLFIALDRKLFHRVLDLTAFRVLRQAVPDVAPFAALVFLEFDCLYVAAVRLQRYADALRTYAVLVLRVLPNLHDRDLDRLRLVCVLEDDRVGVLTGLSQLRLVRQLVAFDLVLFEAVLDLFAVFELRQAAFGVAPRLAFQADRLNELSVRQHLYVDVIRAYAVLILFVEPLLLDRDLDRLRLVAVRQVRDPARFVLALRQRVHAAFLKDFAPAVFDLFAFVVDRQSEDHRRPVVIRCQRVFLFELIAFRVGYFDLFAFARLRAQLHLDLFRSEARAIVVVFPHLQHGQAHPLRIVGVRDLCFAFRRDFIGADRIPFGNLFHPGIIQFHTVFVRRQLGDLQRPLVFAFQLQFCLIRGGLFGLIVRSNLETCVFDIVRQQLQRDCLRTHLLLVLAVVPDLRDSRLGLVRFMRVRDLPAVANHGIVGGVSFDLVFLHRVFDHFAFRVLGQVGEGYGVGVVVIVGHGLHDRRFNRYFFLAYHQVHALRVLRGARTIVVVVFVVVPDLRDLDLRLRLVTVGDCCTGDCFVIKIEVIIFRIIYIVDNIAHGDLAIYFLELDHAVVNLVTIHILGQVIPVDDLVSSNSSLVAVLNVDGDGLFSVVGVRTDKAQGHGFALAGFIVMVFPDLPGIDIDGLRRMAVDNYDREGAVGVLLHINANFVSKSVFSIAHRDFTADIILLGADDFLDGVLIRLGFRILAFGPVVLVQIGPGFIPGIVLVQRNRSAFLDFALVQLYADGRTQAVLIVVINPDLLNGDFGLGLVLVGDLPDAVFVLLGFVDFHIGVVQYITHVFLDSVGDLCLVLVDRQFGEGVAPAVFLQFSLIYRFIVRVQDHVYAVRTHAFSVVKVIPQLDDRHLGLFGLIGVGDRKLAAAAFDLHRVVDAFIIRRGFHNPDPVSVIIGSLAYDFLDGVGDKLAFLLGGQVTEDVRPAVGVVQLLALAFHSHGFGRADLLVQLHGDSTRPAAVAVVSVVPDLFDLDADSLGLKDVGDGGQHTGDSAVAFAKGGLLVLLFFEAPARGQRVLRPGVMLIDALIIIGRHRQYIAGPFIALVQRDSIHRLAVGLQVDDQLFGHVRRRFGAFAVLPDLGHLEVGHFTVIVVGDLESSRLAVFA